VLAPEPIAWLAMGVVIDDHFASALKSMTSLEVSFLAADSRTGGWTLLATTIGADRRAALVEAFARVDPRHLDAVTMQVGDDEYVSRLSRIDQLHDAAIVVALQSSLHEALEPQRRLQTRLIWLGLASLLATGVAGILIGRNITRPVTELSEHARRIEGGDYSEPVKIRREDEIGALASAIDHMRSGIATRETRIRDLAYRDSLTGLPNRARFAEELDNAIRAGIADAGVIAVIVMDMDRFKDVNDTLGHAMGDRLLQVTAGRLQAALLGESEILARLGGDEFGVLARCGDTDSAVDLARHLAKVLDQPVALQGIEIVTSASMGVAIYPQHGDDTSTLTRHAEVAMYAAKRAYAGVTVYEPSSLAPAQQRLTLMAELRHAVEHDELQLYFQPKIDLACNALAGVEALIRWRHPERGVIPPDQFIPFAENTGYIRSITRWVAEAAMRQCVDWHARGLAIKVSMNISARDLVDPDLAEVFGSLLRQLGVKPGWLSLELTESAIMSDPSRARTVIDGLRGLGLEMSIDDFGTGQSSLAYLRRLPVQELKIDKSFVRNIATERDDSIIVRSTIELGHNMGMIVVAEGVEDEGAFELLRDMRCDVAQGYYISRPQAPEPFEQWLIASQWRLFPAEG